MHAIEHILVLSQPKFVERQLDMVFRERAEAAPRRQRIGTWLSRARRSVDA
jgi:hypothetical protein